MHPLRNTALEKALLETNVETGNFGRHNLNSRHFLDNQLEEQIKLMTQLFGRGEEIQECSLVKEYETSGRNKQLDLTTEPCSSNDNKTLTEE